MGITTFLIVTVHIGSGVCGGGDIVSDPFGFIVTVSPAGMSGCDCEGISMMPRQPESINATVHNKRIFLFFSALYVLYVLYPQQ